MSEQEIVLIRQAKEGDRTAFEEMVRRTSRLVFARLYLETGDGHRTEDLLQETYLLAFRSIRKLADPNGFRSWLLAIAQNVLIDAARRDSRQKRSAAIRSDTPLTSLPDSALSPEEMAEREESRQRVLSVLRSLPEEQRLPLTLRYIVGADYETITTQLGLSNGALRGLLHRGLKQLRERLPADLAPGVMG
jgi:RNA polymerase sigma-70 factor (ECF subfamily)